MTSKYPSVTVATKGKAAKAPPTVKGGKPFNKGQFQTVTGVPKIGKVPIGKVPKLKIGRGWIGLLPDAYNAATEIESLIDEKFWNPLFDKWMAPAESVFVNPNPLPTYKYTVVWCEPRAGPPMYFRSGTQSCGFASADNNEFLAGSGSYAFTGTSTAARRIFFRANAVSGTNKFVHHMVGRASLKTGFVEPQPLAEPQPVALASPDPRPAPWAWPVAWPVAAPSVPAQPSPWESPKPGEEPAEETKTEPKPAFAPDTVPLVVPYPGTPFARPPLQPGLPPITFPGTVVRPGPAFPGPKPGAPSPGPDLEVKPTPDFGRPRPPGAKPPSAPGKSARTVEKKANVALVGGVVWAGLNTTTEVFDFVKAMHNSIPKGKHRLSAKASKAQILEYMFTNIEPWKHIDLAEALQNYINMQIGDYVAAFGSNQIKRVSQELGILTGLDRVLRAHSDNLGEAGNWSENVPTLDIDMETGVISVIGPLGALRLKLGGRR